MLILNLPSDYHVKKFEKFYLQQVWGEICLKSVCLEMQKSLIDLRPSAHASNFYTKSKTILV